MVPHYRRMWNKGSLNRTLFYDGDTFGMLTESFLHRQGVHYAGAHVGSEYHYSVDQRVVLDSQDAKRPAGLTSWQSFAHR